MSWYFPQNRYPLLIIGRHSHGAVHTKRSSGNGGGRSLTCSGEKLG